MTTRPNLSTMSMHTEVIIDWRVISSIRLDIKHYMTNVCSLLYRQHGRLARNAYFYIYPVVFNLLDASKASFRIAIVVWRVKAVIFSSLILIANFSYVDFLSMNGLTKLHSVKPKGRHEFSLKSNSSQNSLHFNDSVVRALKGLEKPYHIFISCYEHGRACILKQTEQSAIADQIN